MIFISTNIPIRGKARALKIEPINTVSGIPKPEILRPNQASLSDFSMQYAERILPTTGNTFASNSRIFKIPESKDDSVFWYAKKKEMSKLPRVQLEVFVSETFRSFLSTRLNLSIWLIKQTMPFMFFLRKV